MIKKIHKEERDETSSGKKTTCKKEGTPTKIERSKKDRGGEAAD
jgi:hypothetical protein